jgi:cardiolipin synthase A/B
VKAAAKNPRAGDRRDTPGLRQVADQMFSRASGARLREGNRVRLLKDAAQNYPAWLDAIGAARHTIHFEMYIIHEDDQGRLFADALIEKARQGVRVRLLYDWMGGFGKTSRAFWKRLSAGGVEVRCYNPPRFDSPLGWVSRDHRKMISVDRTIAFVTGLCVGQMWVGDPGRHLDPWRDTGVEVRGPAVADIESAFADAWSAAGGPLEDDTAPAEATASHHAVKDDGVDIAAMRVVATVPNTAGMFRVDQLVAALARKTLWLTDAYYAGTTPYVQALRSAAADGVDVRLLVPGTSDIAALRSLSRAGYRPLLEAGIRVFEWNGSMLHAKTAVADGRWARVGSTNLNVASWLGNRELDVMIEEEPFVRRMEEMYLTDLANSTEVVLDSRNRVRAPGAPHRPHKAASTSTGGRAAAGVMRIGGTVSAAVSNRRVLEPIEAHIALIAGAALAALAFLAFTYPRGIAFPLATIAVWMAAALLFRGLSLLRARTRQDRERVGQRERVSIHNPPVQHKGPEHRA